MLAGLLASGRAVYSETGYGIPSGEGICVLSIEDCVRLAMGSNPSMSEKEFERRIQKAKLSFTKTRFSPDLRVEVSHEEILDSPNDVTGLHGDSVYGKMSESISVTQFLFDGGERFYDLKAAEANLSSAKYEVKRQEQILIYEVKKAYLEVSRRKEILDIKLDSFLSYKDHFEMVKFEFAEGTISKLVVLEVEMSFSNSITELANVLNEYECAISKLNILLGNEVDAPLRIEEIKLVTAEPEKPLKEDALMKAYLNRPEIFKMNSKIIAGNMKLKKAKAGYYPALDLEGEYNFTQEDEQDNCEDWSVKLKVSLPIIFGTWQTKTKVDMAKAEVLKNDSQKEKLKQIINFEVNRACADLESSCTRLSGLKRKLQTAEDKLEILEVEKELGTTSRKDFVFSLVEFNKAKEEYLNAFYRYCGDRITLDRVVAADNYYVLF